MAITSFEGSEEDRQAYTLFLDTRKSPITKSTYDTGVKILTSSDPARFLALARSDRKLVENSLLAWIVENKQRLSGASIRAYLASLKSFCVFCEVSLNWNKVNSACPETPKGKDRAILLEEIRSIYDAADLREKFAISFYLSSGARLASVDYLKVGHVEKIEGTTVAKVTIYKAQAEEYITFLSSECVKDMDNYLAFRKRSGEEIKAESPLFRSYFDANSPSALKIRDASSHAIKGEIQRLWEKAGFKERDFKQVHGFRKTFKSRLEGSGMKSVLIERLLGHTDGLNGNYYRPTLEEMAQEYEKFQNFLFIDEGLLAKSEVKQIQESTSRSLKDTEVNLILANQRIAKLEADRENDREAYTELLEWVRKQKEK